MLVQIIFVFYFVLYAVIPTIFISLFGTILSSAGKKAKIVEKFDY